MITISQATIQHFLEILKSKNIECHALSISQNHHILLEKSFSPYTLDSLHPVYSVTKSFTSMAIGFLEEEGKININDSWLSYFPEYKCYVADPRLSQVTIKNLLTMTLGQDCEVELVDGDDWVLSVIGKKLSYDPGSIYFYNSHCSHLLSALVTQLTGEKMVDYLKTRLFEPLEFQDYYWQEDPQGRTIGGYGLHICIHDLMKFGQCCLDYGVYNGKQVLPRQWVEKATQFQMKNANVYPMTRSENRQGYGYHFWMCTHGGYRCSGLHAQICFMHPENNLVVAMFNNASGSQVILESLFQAIEDQVEYAKESDFQLSPVEGRQNEEVIESWLGQRILAYTNYFQLDWIEFHKINDFLKINISKNNQIYSVEAKYNQWYAQDNHFHCFNKFNIHGYVENEQPDYVNNTLFASYAWETSTTMVVQIRELDHSACTTLRFAFDKSHIVLYYQVTGLYTTLIETKCIFKR